MADPRPEDEIRADADERVEAGSKTPADPAGERELPSPYPAVIGEYRADAIPVPHKQEANRWLKMLGNALMFMIPVRERTFPDRMIEVAEKHRTALAQIPAGRELLKATTLPADAEEGRWFTFADDHYATRTREGWRMHAYERPSETRSLALVVRSLRRSEQESRLFHLLEAELTPEHQLHLQRFRDADATAAMIQTAWELNRAGVRSAWRDLGRMDEVQPMLDAYKAALKDDRQAGRNGKAVRAAFDEWFKSQARINARDAVTLADMGQRPNRFAGDEDASEVLLASAIARLGWRPGLNYLDGGAELSSRRYFKTPGKENSAVLAQIEEGVRDQLSVRSLTEQRQLQRQTNSSLEYAALPLKWPVTEPVAEDQPAAVEPEAPSVDPKSVKPAKPVEPVAERRRPTEAEVSKIAAEAVADELGVDLDELEAERANTAGVKAVADELDVDLAELDAESKAGKGAEDGGWEVTTPDPADAPAHVRKRGSSARREPFWKGWLKAFSPAEPMPVSKRKDPVIGDWSGLKADDLTHTGPDGKIRRTPTIGKPGA